jgi:hypothetical protein
MSKKSDKLLRNTFFIRVMRTTILCTLAVICVSYVVFMMTSSHSLKWTNGMFLSEYSETTATAKPTEVPEQTPDPTAEPTVSATMNESATTPPPASWESEAPKYAGIDLTKVLFIGDSITQGLQVYSVIPGLNVIANMGMSSYNLMEHLDAINDLKPTEIFILIGLNDMGGSTENEMFFTNYGEFIRAVQKALPKTRIIVQAMLPVTKYVDETNGNVTNEIINAFNIRLLKMANELGVVFANVRSIFQDANGYLRSDISPDGIHFYTETYYIWMEKLIPYMK